MTLRAAAVLRKRNIALRRAWDTLTICLAVVFVWHSSLPTPEQKSAILALECTWFLLGGWRVPGHSVAHHHCAWIRPPG
jgi:hypothetical protein